jgi:hypothetical protein
MRLDSSGNFGIGTTSPSNKLAVCDSNGTGLEIAPNDTSEQVVVLSYDRGQTAYRRINFNALDYIFRTSATERMRITSAGTLLLRSGAFPTNQDSPFLYRIGGGSLAIGSATETGSGAYVALYTNSSERMRIDSSGRVCIDDVINTNTKFHIYNNNASITYALGIESTQYAGTHVQFKGSAGVTGTISYSGTSTSYNTSSDYRLKEDLQNFAGLDMVSKIPVYDFKWKTDESRSYGVMAHELQEVLPDAVSGEKDAEEMQGVDYSKIVPLLIKSIQELKAEIELLKSK